MILGWLDEAVRSGSRLAPACAELGLNPRTVQRWRNLGVCDDRRNGPKTAPANKLSAEERKKVLEVANSPEYRDLSPKQIVPKLADRGEYVASEPTFYRILRQEDQMSHRGRSEAPSRHRPSEHRAMGPNQVWSWDITYLRSPVAGMFFYLYLFVDVWSRKIVAHQVHAEESSDLASDLLEAALEREGLSEVELVVHSDNGSPMKGATLKATMERLGVIPSYSRPRVSDDNPYSESLFRTLKYRPEYPRRPFQSLEDARRWVDGFVGWYHTEHLHSGIGYVSPLDRHAGRDEAVLAARRAVYDAAMKRHPERWAQGRTRTWDAPDEVILNPMKDSRLEMTPVSTRGSSAVVQGRPQGDGRKRDPLKGSPGQSPLRKSTNVEAPVGDGADRNEAHARSRDARERRPRSVAA
jgi:transposase InsO family protein